MADIRNRRCRYEGCTKQPGFNYEGQKSALYCNLHKLEGMINVVNKSCDGTDCYIRPNYNYPGEKSGLYCNRHRLEGMINLSSNKKKRSYTDRENYSTIDCKVQKTS